MQNSKTSCPAYTFLANLSADRTLFAPYRAMSAGSNLNLVPANHVYYTTMEQKQQAPKKRRKYSKKSKKNLRKYTDVRDVEEFLEEQRFQERTGYDSLRFVACVLAE